jgi:hypothetical protein
MAWNLEGRYFENCSCNVPCPCTASLDLGADYDFCHALLAFHVDSGDVEGVDVSVLTVATVVDTPKVMSEGNWRLALLIDEAASDEQAEKLGAVFGGQMGGPMEALAPLLGEVLGVERTPMEFSSENGHHRLKAGDAAEMEVEDVVPFGVETGQPAALTGVNHPAGSTLTIGKAKGSRVNVLGLEFSHPGQSGFSTRFSWSG